MSQIANFFKSGYVGETGNIAETANMHHFFNFFIATAMNYTIALNNGSEGISVNPSNGVIQARGNTTVTVTLNVPSNATDGLHNGPLIVNTTQSSNFGGAVILPAITAKITYKVNGTAPTARIEQTGTDPLLIAGAVVILAVIAAGGAYMLMLRRKG